MLPPISVDILLRRYIWNWYESCFFYQMSNFISVHRFRPEDGPSFIFHFIELLDSKICQYRDSKIWQLPLSIYCLEL